MSPIHLHCAVFPFVTLRTSTYNLLRETAQKPCEVFLRLCTKAEASVRTYCGLICGLHTQICWRRFTILHLARKVKYMQPSWRFHLASHQNLVMLQVFCKGNLKSFCRGQRIQYGTLITNCLLGFNITEIYINVLSGTTKNTPFEFLQHAHLSSMWIHNARYYVCLLLHTHDAMDDVNVDLCRFMKQTLMEHKPPSKYVNQMEKFFHDSFP